MDFINSANLGTCALVDSLCQGAEWVIKQALKQLKVSGPAGKQKRTLRHNPAPARAC